VVKRDMEATFTSQLRGSLGGNPTQFGTTLVSAVIVFLETQLRGSLGGNPTQFGTTLASARS
jgi:hypothetical protein